MSARAAARLERYGFQQTYRYPGGKVDWVASGYPSEGELAAVPRLRDRMRRDVPVCGPEERVGAVAARVHDTGWDCCAVVDGRHVILGLLRRQLGQSDCADARAEDVMHLGPRTYRPHVLFEAPLEYMRTRNLRSVLVTTSDAVLLGAVTREDAEREVNGHR